MDQPNQQKPVEGSHETPVTEDIVRSEIMENSSVVEGIGTESNVESSKVQENFNMTPASPVADTSTSANNDDNSVILDDSDDKNASVDAKSEMSQQVDAKDLPWIGKAKKIIKEFDDKPYEEEEAQEQLEREYMNSRFGVKIKDDEDTK